MNINNNKYHFSEKTFLAVSKAPNDLQLGYLLDSVLIINDELDNIEMREGLSSPEFQNALKRLKIMDKTIRKFCKYL